MGLHSCIYNEYELPCNLTHKWSSFEIIDQNQTKESKKEGALFDWLS